MIGPQSSWDLPVTFDSGDYLEWINSDKSYSLKMPRTVFLHDVQSGDYTRIQDIDTMKAPSELWSFTDLLDKKNKYNNRIKEVVALASLILVQDRLLDPVTNTARLVIGIGLEQRKPLTTFATFDERYGHTFRTRDYMIKLLRIKQGE